MNRFSNIVSPAHQDDEKNVIRAFGDEMRLKLDTRATGGELTLWLNTTPPGGGPPPHYHLHEDELFMVQEGRVSFFLNGRWQETGPGSVAFAPRGKVHAFCNIGSTPSRMLILTQPSGFEIFFAKCAGEFAKPGGPNMLRIIEISAEHGIHYVDEASEVGHVASLGSPVLAQA